MFIETKMFLFVGALILYIETVTSCGESGRLIICKYLGKISKNAVVFPLFKLILYLIFMVFHEKLFFQAKKSLEKSQKQVFFIHYLIFDFYSTFFVG